MKNASPRQLALVLALVLASFSGLLCMVLTNMLFGAVHWDFVWIASLSVFVASYLLIFFFLRNFINYRIQLIYKTIHTLKRKDGQTFLPLSGNEDMLGRVESEVAEWAKNHVSEIEDLRKLENYRREFLGNVSHELKTPIFNIQGYISTLLDGGLEDPNINRNYLERAERGVERMINIVEDLESISRLESGELLLDQREFDVVRLTQEIYDSQEMRAGQRRIKLRFRENYSRPINVYADKNLIRQVITNLIVNSIKYGKEGGETEVRFYDMDENILVEIADNGLGIAKEHLPRLFERFYRVDKGRSRDQGGTGLGLAIVKHIIEAHHQTINVRSAEGAGSTFSFTLKKA